MKIQGIKGTVSFNLSVIEGMTEAAFVKKVDNQFADSKAVYKKLKAEIKRLADEEAKAEKEAEDKAAKEKEAPKKKEATA